MKKLLAILLAVVMVLSLTVCASADPATEISLWTYPIGAWGNQEAVNALMASFKEATGITVNVEYLTYADGDDKVNTAIEGGAAPDLIMEGPERLVANWGAKGKMVNIADLFDENDLAEINPAALKPCFTADGTAAYEYPVVMTAHCMAINKTVFESAGAMQYIDEETHTWTTEGFLAAVKAVYDAGYENVGVVFCGGQGGDQGNRALINNLYGGTFTNAEHTAYTADSAENIKALETLYAMEAINFDPAIVGGDEINLFRQGIFQMATCWNIAQQLNSDNNDAGLTNSGDEILFMAFPSANGTDSQLCGGIWGFGIFDNGDAARIEAAKTFIKYMADSEAVVDAVKTASYFAVRDAVDGTDISGIWADNAVMSEYNKLMPMLGDYYQVTGGWAVARTEWWNMLQRIGAGGNAAEEVAVFVANANAAAQG